MVNLSKIEVVDIQKIVDEIMDEIMDDLVHKARDILLDKLTKEFIASPCIRVLE
jgi:hypothetical protein